jgi:hypothetical protein
MIEHQAARIVCSVEGVPFVFIVYKALNVALTMAKRDTSRKKLLQVCGARVIGCADSNGSLVAQIVSCLERCWKPMRFSVIDGRNFDDVCSLLRIINNPKLARFVELLARLFSVSLMMIFQASVTVLPSSNAR